MIGKNQLKNVDSEDFCGVFEIELLLHLLDHLHLILIHNFEKC